MCDQKHANGCLCFSFHHSCLVMGLVMDTCLLLECGRKLKHQFDLRLSAYLVIRKGKCWARLFCVVWLRNLAGDALTALLMGRRKTWGPRNRSDLVVHQNSPWLVWSLGLCGDFFFSGYDLSATEGVSSGLHGRKHACLHVHIRKS